MLALRTLAALAVSVPLSLSCATALAKVGSCDEPILLGTTISMSGTYSTLAERYAKMTETFAEELNKTGGVFLKDCNKKLPIKFIMYDDQSVPAVGVQLIEKMATVDMVDFFVGPDWSVFGGPVPPVAERHKIPMVMSSVSTLSLFERGLKYFQGVQVPARRWSETYFDMLSKMSPKPQSVFFVTQDNPLTRGITDYWSKKSQEMGFKLAGSELFPSDLKDFTAIISKMRSAKPDVIYISSFDAPSAPLVQQMRRLKVRAMDVHHTTLTGALHRQLGKDLDGMTSELTWYPGVKGDYSELVETVLKRANVDVFDYIFAYTRMQAYLVMIQAIERAGAVDREKVREALYKGSFKSPAGTIAFDEKGMSNDGMFATQMQNGKVVIIWPPKNQTGKPIWPAPSWQ
jgi:ABC-type branched-subunit amino acid transport system substrate-binding protein